VTSYGDTLHSINLNGWVNWISFSPDSKTVSFVTHDCELNFTDVSEATVKDKSKLTTEKVYHPGNPHMSCIFLNNESLVACGYDKVPYLYKKKGSEWAMEKILDDGTKRVRKPKITGNSFLDKKVYFNADIKLDSKIEMKESDTKHHNFINCLKPFASDSNGVPQVLATSDGNGFINFWDVQKL
jgi:hypothetical protein